jgi:hypothetical protein
MIAGSSTQVQTGANLPRKIKVISELAMSSNINLEELLKY